MCWQPWGGLTAPASSRSTGYWYVAAFVLRLVGGVTNPKTKIFLYGTVFCGSSWERNFIGRRSFKSLENSKDSLKQSITMFTLLFFAALLTLSFAQDQHEHHTHPMPPQTTEMSKTKGGGDLGGGCICPEIYDPVCSNGLTFPNSCKFCCQATEGRYTKADTNGYCEDVNDSLVTQDVNVFTIVPTYSTQQALDIPSTTWEMPSFSTLVSKQVIGVWIGTRQKVGNSTCAPFSVVSSPLNSLFVYVEWMLAVAEHSNILFSPPFFNVLQTNPKHTETDMVQVYSCTTDVEQGLENLCDLSPFQHETITCQKTNNHKNKNQGRRLPRVLKEAITTTIITTKQEIKRWRMMKMKNGEAVDLNCLALFFCFSRKRERGRLGIGGGTSNETGSLTPTTTHKTDSYSFSFWLFYYVLRCVESRW